MYMLAREGALPGVLTKLWLRSGAPVVALATLWVGCALCIGTTMRAGLALQFAVLAAVIECIVYALLLVGAFINRRRGGPVAGQHFHSRLHGAAFPVVAFFLVAICIVVLGAGSKLVTAAFIAALSGATVLSGVVATRRASAAGET